MRFLHTADWHAGKKLGRIDRTAEFEAVFDEIVEIARDQKVDAVLVSGDLFDRAIPPLDAISLVVDTLIRLADAAGRVVAICGNHDSADLFRILGRLLEGRNIQIGASILRPEEGGVVTIASRDGAESASIGLLPFLQESAVVDFMQDRGEWFGDYSDRIRGLGHALASAFEPGGIGILMAHYFVEGAELGGGERRIHIGEQYAATAQAIPPGPSYVALGHIHRPQLVPGAAVMARYSGSLLQLDFSERTHLKEVVIVDAKPGIPAKVKSIQLRSGRKLIRVEDEIDSLRARAEDGEFGDAFLDVRIKTSGPVFGLSEDVRKFLPNAVLVQPVYERVDGKGQAERRSDAPMADVYAEYHEIAHGVAAPADLLDAMRIIEEEVVSAAT